MLNHCPPTNDSFKIVRVAIGVHMLPTILFWSKILACNTRPGFVQYLHRTTNCLVLFVIHGGYVYKSSNYCGSYSCYYLQSAEFLWYFSLHFCEECWDLFVLLFALGFFTLVTICSVLIMVLRCPHNEWSSQSLFVLGFPVEGYPVRTNVLMSFWLNGFRIFVPTV